MKSLKLKAALSICMKTLIYNFSPSPPPRFPSPPPHLTDPWKKPCRSSQQERVRWVGTDVQHILSIVLEACCAPSVHVNIHEGFLIPLLCRATWNVGPADLSAASWCQSQRGHGLPQRCLQWEELGIPHEGEVITPKSESMSDVICCCTVKFMFMNTVVFGIRRDDRWKAVFEYRLLMW